MAVASKWLEATVTGHKRWTERLYSLQLVADGPAFQAGQFAKLALEIDGEMVARPYSFVNAPGTQPHEFYYITVPGGPLTARLLALKPGDRIGLAPTVAGFLVLAEVPDARNLWLLSTGTALGPFLSILGTAAPWQRYDEIVLVHAVRQAAELTYRETIESLMKAHPGQLRVVSFVSREDCSGALTGRVPQAMICGNPAMVADTVEALKARGMKKHRRRDPGQITVENYW